MSIEEISRGPVLVFSDVHAPFQHKDALDFLRDTYVRYNCKSVVCAGDLRDTHRGSRHTPEVDAMNAVEEYEEYLKFAGKLMKLFPKGNFVGGNHDFIVHRQLKELGIPTNVLKKPNELLGLTNKWVVHDHYYVIAFGEKNKVLVEHGMGSSGMNGAINMALAKRISYVQGHTHSYGGVTYRQNHDSCLFGLNTGCLCDKDSYAQRYGKYNKFNGTTGCGVVFSATDAIFEKMQE